MANTPNEAGTGPSDTPISEIPWEERVQLCIQEIDATNCPKRTAAKKWDVNESTVRYRLDSRVSGGGLGHARQMYLSPSPVSICLVASLVLSHSPHPYLLPNLLNSTTYVPTLPSTRV